MRGGSEGRSAIADQAPRGGEEQTGGDHLRHVAGQERADAHGERTPIGSEHRDVDHVGKPERAEHVDHEVGGHDGDGGGVAVSIVLLFLAQRYFRKVQNKFPERL